MNIRDDEDCERAITMVKEVRDIIPLTEEPISITYEQADLLIKQANRSIRELHQLAQKKDSPYYNWPEEL